MICVNPNHNVCRGGFTANVLDDVANTVAAIKTSSRCEKKKAMKSRSVAHRVGDITATASAVETESVGDVSVSVASSDTQVHGRTKRIRAHKLPGHRLGNTERRRR